MKDEREPPQAPIPHVMERFGNGGFRCITCGGKRRSCATIPEIPRAAAPAKPVEIRAPDRRPRSRFYRY